MGALARSCRVGGVGRERGLKSDKYLVAGRKVTASSNAEEEAVGLTRVMPFLLALELVKRGAHYSKAGLWQRYIQVDERLVTGQNPASASASAGGVGAAVAALLSKR